MNALVRFGTAAIATAAVILGGSGAANADDLPQQASAYNWVWGSNSCLYLSDDGGVTGALAVCPIRNGIEIDVASNGQWAIAGQYANRDPWAVDSAAWLAEVNGGGASMTGDPRVDGYLTAVNQALTDPWVQQKCIQTIGDVCYI